jgi:hypothetical protein
MLLRDGVATERIWIDERIHYTLKHITRDYHTQTGYLGNGPHCVAW